MAGIGAYVREVLRHGLGASAASAVIPARDTIAIYGITAEPINAGLNIVNVAIEADCPVVGVRPYGGGEPLTGELIFPVTRKTARVSAFLPAGTDQIVFRNVTNSSLPIEFSCARWRYTRFVEPKRLISPALARRIAAAPKHVFIHTIGKTGSVSLQETLRPFHQVLCSRDHIIDLPRIPPNRTHPAFGVLQSLSLESLVSKRLIMYLLDRSRANPDFTDVICGVRRVDSLVPATVFQNEGDHFNAWGLSPEAVGRCIELQTAPLLALFEWWWTTQFLDMHGFGLDQLAQGLRRDRLTWTFTAPSGIKFRFYRIEDGEAALRECLSPYARYAGQASFPDRIARTNVGAEKGYAGLYAEAKKHFDAESVRARRPPTLRRIEELFYGNS